MTQVNLVVGYLATPGGADALALAVRFARTPGRRRSTSASCCRPTPRRRAPCPKVAATRKCWPSRHRAGWTTRWPRCPTTLWRTPHLSFDESFADGLDPRGAALAGERHRGRRCRRGTGRQLSHWGRWSTSCCTPRPCRSRWRREEPAIRGSSGCTRSPAPSANVRVRICCWTPRYGPAGPRTSRCGWCRWWRSIRPSARCVVTTRRVAGMRSRTPERTLEAAKDELPADFPVTSTIVNGPTRRGCGRAAGAGMTATSSWSGPAGSARRGGSSSVPRRPRCCGCWTCPWWSCPETN